MHVMFAFLLVLAMTPYAAIAGSFLDIDDAPDFIVKPVTPAIIQQLRGGGFVIYMRHANTDISHPDRLPAVDLNDCSTQRQLTDEGRLVAARIGRHMRRLKIPIGEIYSSPMCRAKDTALAAFGPNFSINEHLMYTSNITDKDKGPILQATRELLAQPVQGKVNRVVVAHSQNLMELIGYLPKPEGTVVIFKPGDNKNFQYIASITPEQWKYLQPRPAE